MLNLFRKTEYVLILGLILVGLLLFAEIASGQVLEPLNLTSLAISPEKNKAKIEWTTNFVTTGRINFGETQNFGSWVMEQENEINHETWLAGLKSDTKYYFQLLAYDHYGRVYTSVIYNFETDEDDEVGPTLSKISASFVSGNRALITWETDELADACVSFGTQMDKLNKKKCEGGRTLIHEVVLTGLTRNTFYYFRVASQDKQRNKTESVFYNFHTYLADDKDLPDLTVRQTKLKTELNREGKVILSLTFMANRPVSGTLKLGEKTGKYNKTYKLNAPRSTEPTLVLSDLESYKQYYYLLEVKDIFNKSLKTPEQIVFTPANNYYIAGQTSVDDYRPSDPDQDFDADGLTNEQERIWKTSPIKADSDGDGYVDGQEVRYGYNPLGSGRLTAVAGLKIYTFAYDQPRLTSLQAEKNLANELKRSLEKLFRGPIPVAKSGWPTLVNSYIYGGYSAEAIYQAIIHSGKTVHPTISWSAWKNSSDYKKYIN